MIKKLTMKDLMQMAILELFCFGLGGIMLAHYAPSAMDALSGRVPRLDESMTNIYGCSALALFFVLLGVFILVKTAVNTVGKRVGRYLDAHPDVDMAQIDSDFEAAEAFSKIWVGRRWTYSLDLKNVLVDNADIVWVHTETERSRNKIIYYLCLGLKDGCEMRAETSEKGFSQLLDMYKQYPHIVVGNDPDYAYLFRDKLQEFLDMKYNANK